MYFFLLLILVLIVWSIWGYLSSHVEQSSFTVVKKEKGYEIRMYPPHIVAQTTVKGKYEDSLNEGFGIVAGYIFGGNAKKEKIAMTAPVIEQKNESVKIPMTAPVIASLEGESHKISFVMPKIYNLDSLPVPLDSRVKLVKMPERKMAVVRFSWVRTGDRVQRMKLKLLNALSTDKIEVIGAPSYAGYNAPWTPPWMTKHEVMVEVK